MNILVTGACGGIGRAVCDRLSAGGHRVYGLDLRCEQEPNGWQFLPCDVRSEAQVQAAVSLAVQEEGLDAVLHFAGVYELDSLVEMSEEALLRVFDINVFGAARVNRLCMAHLKPQARILLTGSELAPLKQLPFTGIYGISKGTVEQYADALRMELNLLGHRVILLRPGAVRTGLLRISTARLSRFAAETKLYSTNAERFRRIVDAVEARSVSPERVAALVERMLRSKRPRQRYCINRNPLLLLMNVVPRRWLCAIIKRILTP